MLFRFVIAFLLFCNSYFYAKDSTLVLKRKKIIVGTSVITAYSGSLMYLNQIWYKPYRTSQFHFFDDNSEWLKTDKIGHVFTAYQSSLYLEKLFQYAHFKHPDIYASLVAWTYLLNIEIMDGFSSGWGFSISDFTANTLGTALFFINKKYLSFLLVPKFSVTHTIYAEYNKNLLGSTDFERIIKDYNGQTYWISFSPFHQWKKNMEWLCVSFGYGIDGCIGAKSNVYFRNNQWYNFDYIKRQQQFYFSIDIDLSKIKTKKEWLNNILKTLNWIKIPAPAIELKGNNLYFRPILFSN